MGRLRLHRGLQTRRHSALTVLLVSQAVGLVLAFGTALALGFGVFFLLLVDHVAERDTAWTIAGLRVGGVALVGVAALVARPTLPTAGARVLAPLVLVGLLDLLANALYAAATTRGLVSLVSVATSFYAAVTALLARLVLGERLAPSQRAGLSGRPRRRADRRRCLALASGVGR